MLSTGAHRETQKRGANIEYLNSFLMTSLKKGLPQNEMTPLFYFIFCRVSDPDPDPDPDLQDPHVFALPGSGYGSA